MNEFIAKYGKQLSGTLAGFDRLVFRGTNGLHYTAERKGYLWANHLGLKDFGEHAQWVSGRVKKAAPPGGNACSSISTGYTRCLGS